MRTSHRRVFGVAAAAGLLFGLVSAGLATATGHSVRPWLCCALALVAALGIAALWLASFAALEVDLEAPRRPLPEMLTDRKRGGIEQTARMVERAGADADRVESVRRRLVAIADERLRTTHGIDLRAEPERARALLGDGLADLLAAPSRRRLTHDELSAHLERLEQL